jgi:hypothetical protein
MERDQFILRLLQLAQRALNAHERTGQGPNTLLVLSDIEDLVIDLLELQESDREGPIAVIYERATKKEMVEFVKSARH